MAKVKTNKARLPKAWMDAWASMSGEETDDADGGRSANQFTLALVDGRPAIVERDRLTGRPLARPATPCGGILVIKGGQDTTRPQIGRVDRGIRGTRCFQNRGLRGLPLSAPFIELRDGRVVLAKSLADFPGVVLCTTPDFRPVTKGGNSSLILAVDRFPSRAAREDIKILASVTLAETGASVTDWLAAIGELREQAGDNPIWVVRHA